MILFEIKAIISDNNGLLSDHTIYLFNKEQDILLPIKVGQGGVDNLLLAKDGRPEVRPHIHSTTKRLINALNGNIDRVIINKYVDGIFYSYIRVGQGKRKVDVDAKPSDALCVALRSKSKIYATESVVKSAGIVITPEILKVIKEI